MKCLAPFLMFLAMLPARAYATCPVDQPSKGIFAYPALMEAHVAFKDYEIRIFDSNICGDESPFKQRSGFEILKEGISIYRQTGFSFAIGYPLQDDQSTDSIKLRVGDDIIGSGEPGLLISEWSGGAHCCYTFHVFQLGLTFRKIQSIPLLDADGSSFVRRPGTEGMVLYTADYSDFAYFPYGFGGSPAGRVFMSFQGSRFRPDLGLMRSNTAAMADVEACANLFKQSRDWRELIAPQPKGMWYYATDLIYTGNADAARAFLEGAWGGSKEDKVRYLKEYWLRLQRSMYYKELMQLQKTPASNQNQKIDWTKQCFEYMHG